jgi:hypothetical protein
VTRSLSLERIIGLGVASLVGARSTCGAGLACGVEDVEVAAVAGFLGPRSPPASRTAMTTSRLRVPSSE